MALASRLLEMNTGSWNPSEYLGVETAIGLFKQSGLSFKQIRDIWSIADKDGTGKLTKPELAVVIRLAGWVQAGEILDEKLLKTEGPLPKIKGISDAKAPSIEQTLPPVTSADVAEFKEAFFSRSPVDGLLPKRSVMSLYMASDPDLSFELLYRVMKLIDTKTGFYDFKSFAVGLHTVRSLNKALISSVPSSISSEDLESMEQIFETWDREGVSDHTEEGFDLSPQADSDIRNFIEDIQSCRHISGKMALDFRLKYNVHPTELSQLWHQSNVESGPELSTARMACFEKLLRKRVAKQIPTPESPALSRRDSSRFPCPVDQSVTVETIQRPSDSSSSSVNRAANIDPIPTSPDQASQNPPSYAFFTTPHENIIQTFKDDIGQLASHFETIATDRKWAHAELQKNFDALGRENLHLKQQQKVLEYRLASKDESGRKAEKVINSIKLDLLEQQVLSKEHEEEAINAHNEAGRLWNIIETQSRQITTLLELVADMKTTITELNVKPDSSDLRLRFLRATARESEAAATKAVEEAVALREIIKARDEEIVKLRRSLNVNHTQQAPADSPTAIQLLREDQEDLKLQVENMQRLLEHIMTTRPSPGTVEDEETLVQPSAPLNSVVKPESSCVKLSEASSQHSKILSKEHDYEMPSVPPSISPKSPTSSRYSTRPSSLACMSASNVSPFQLFRKISAASSLVRSCSGTTTPISVKVDNMPQDISQLENDLFLFRLHIQRKGYIGIEMVERFISNYDIDVHSLDEIGRFVGLDASVKRINQAVDLIRQAVIGARDPNLSVTPLPTTPKRPASPVQAMPETMLSNAARRNQQNSSTTSQPSHAQFYNPPDPSSSFSRRNISIPKSITSSGIASITSILSTVNSSVQSTRAVCNSS
ncbi:putative calcium-binding protein [Psilocybe cubensis]|uniref:Calcium-binding protein n=2 Tax=Psilocybe cubensis TaxID=181762 RepID=A0ACB8GKM1_PSICU|nr:putative calcium-binding protein [Psilocybe cubensis]KAH9476238.1 putative calcium-binding protein [Psilocybe cubensis]